MKAYFTTCHNSQLFLCLCTPSCLSCAMGVSQSRFSSWRHWQVLCEDLEPDFCAAWWSMVNHPGCHENIPMRSSGVSQWASHETATFHVLPRGDQWEHFCEEVRSLFLAIQHGEDSNLCCSWISNPKYYDDHVDHCCHHLDPVMRIGWQCTPRSPMWAVAAGGFQSKVG